jgi:hypothetical protein
MQITIHPHAQQRMIERGAEEVEVIKTIAEGEKFSAKYGRIGFRRNFVFNNVWRNEKYNSKQLEVYGVEEGKAFIVITVLVKYF